MPDLGKWCLGHGVPAVDESLRTGHYVEAYLVPDNFAVRNGEARGSKGLAPTLEPRCNHCRSIRRWHDHGANALRRARAWRGQHAERWVNAGKASSIERVFEEMDIGGVTEEALCGSILAAIGELCPGMCAHEENGQIIRHTIDRVADLHIDVRDPDQPFTLENIGILCNSCNPAKGSMPWARFIYRRRAQLRAWQDALDHPEYRRPEQLGFDW